MISDTNLCSNNQTASFARRQAAVMPAYTTGCHGCCLSAVELPLRSGQRQCWLIQTIRAVHGYRLAASDVLRPRRALCCIGVCHRKKAYGTHLLHHSPAFGERFTYSVHGV